MCASNMRSSTGVLSAWTGEGCVVVHRFFSFSFSFCLFALMVGGLEVKVGCACGDCQ